MKKRSKTGYWILAAVLLILLAAAAFPVSNYFHTVTVYKDALELIEDGQYKEASTVLEEIKKEDYKDTLSLMSLCRAHIKYESDNIAIAYNALKDAEFYYLDDAMEAEVSDFKAALSEEYEAYCSELAAIEMQELEDRIKNGVPYVGMSETRINDTSLGSASEKVRHNYESKNGEQYIANLYDFYEGDTVIFTARCVQGFVTEVWDHRDRLQTAGEDSGTGSGKTWHSEPSVDGFKNPEDFYDFYWDDFADYEAAEDYYYEHGGK